MYIFLNQRSLFYLLFFLRLFNNTVRCRATRSCILPLLWRDNQLIYSFCANDLNYIICMNAIFYDYRNKLHDSGGLTWRIIMIMKCEINTIICDDLFNNIIIFDNTSHCLIIYSIKHCTLKHAHVNVMRWIDISILWMQTFIFLLKYSRYILNLFSI